MSKEIDKQEIKELLNEIVFLKARVNLYRQEADEIKEALARKSMGLRIFIALFVSLLLLTIILGVFHGR